MSKTTEALHASAEKWLPKNGRQQLYWVLLVSFALLLGIQASEWLQREPAESPAPAVVTTDSADAVTLPDTTAAANATAAPDAQDDIVVEAVTVAVDDPADRSTTTADPVEQSVASSEQPRAVEQQADVLTDRDIVARVFAALGGAGQAHVTEPASQPVSGPADLPDFFAALARYTAPSQDTSAERESRQRRVTYLFTLHAPPAPNSTSEFLARQLSKSRGQSPPQDVAQGPVTSDPQSTTIATTSEESATSTPNPDTVPETTTQPADSAAVSREPAVDVAAQADTAAAHSESAQELPIAELVLVNPVESGGTILYLVEGRAFSLTPGQSHRLPADRPWRVAFHRGEDFGDAEILLTTGEFKFTVGQQGWRLVPAADAP